MGTFQIDNTIKEQEKAVLIGLVTREQNEEKTHEYLDELQFLAETAGAITQKRFWQKLQHPDVATYLGKGKIEEVSEYVKENGIDLVLVDDEISPSQLRNIEKYAKCKVLDRSMLILDIFAQRARTLQAKTQVELAQLQYMLPRLKGLWSHLDRVKGGIGMKGAGEKEIETDRRIAQTRISLLKRQLSEIDKQNETRRKNRSEMIRVALVGYTNVGKSTLLNLLAKEQVFAENKLFATLDTTVRKVVFNTVPFLLSDTVGFIRKLPHHLIESFKSTLDETLEADILLHVVDISHPAFVEQINVVNNILEELKANDKPTIIIFNKMDLYEQKTFDEFLPQEIKKGLLSELEQTWMAKTNDNAIFVSATTNRNTAALRERIFKKVKELYLERYPYKAGYWSEYF
ncbi:MAG: GTPase HflX [Chitinophagales bacterium]|nr:GTPase HflX [Chitinophagales bacterium]MCO5280177.1 GTPase HflX [Chitinophagales bacterium]OJV25491.1 MAG: GTPase HflX [Bacteroidetes bacterium 37-13]HRN93481.1 GTPase HflX [Chitinophagales bacterium]HRP38072.1 GTPase HflX [Chitinophagales bacterium]